jgi:hypothetical protein
VALLAKELSDSNAQIAGKQSSPKNEICMDKLRSLGMSFGGDDLLRATIQKMIGAIKAGN